MRAVAALVIWIASVATAYSDGTPKPMTEPEYTAIAFHDVVDSRSGLSFDAITTTELIRFFDWLKGNGWSPISIEDIERAESGVRPLPQKPILLTFDDGLESAYSKVYPLLLAYRYPAVIAITGSWMAGAAGSTVRYGDQEVPRSTFLSWDQVREMAASGLVEVGSHSYNLHTGILANPQGNLVPAGVTWSFDPATGQYEDDVAYRRRIRDDLSAARKQMEQELGTAPRVLIWPFGRRTGPASEEAGKLGFMHELTLYEAPNTLGSSSTINRFYPSQNPRLADLAAALRFDEPISETKRIACFAMNELGAAGNADDAERRLGRMVDVADAIGANIVVMDVARVPPVSPAGIDILSHAVWQMRTRVGAEVYLKLALPANQAAVADLLRRAKADGLALQAEESLLVAGAQGEDPPPSRLVDIQKMRASLDVNRLDPADRLAMQAFAEATAIAPDLKLMLTPASPPPMTGWPAPVADLLLLPAASPGKLEENLASLQKAGWLSPAEGPRVAVGLAGGSSADIARQVRMAQAHGATALAICPPSGSLQLAPEEAAIVSTVFSSRTLPREP